MDLYATGELNEKERDENLDKILKIASRMEEHQELIIKEKVMEIKEDKMLRYLFMDLNCLSNEDMSMFQKTMILEKIP